jgi:hypothetical protein
MSSSVAEIPVDDREVSLIVHGRSSDYQDVAVQGVVTYGGLRASIGIAKQRLRLVRGAA